MGTKANPVSSLIGANGAKSTHTSLKKKAMNSSRRLLASATSARGGNGLRPEPLALLPPIPLYRRLFRAHRKHLPQQMRVLGDEYIKHEFRAHRNVDNPAHLVNHRKNPLFSTRHARCFDRFADMGLAVCRSGS